MGHFDVSASAPGCVWHIFSLTRIAQKRGCDSRVRIYHHTVAAAPNFYISIPFRSVKVSFSSVPTVAFSTISRQPFALEILALRMHAAGLTRSMSKKGCSPDNAAYERKILRTSEK